MINESVVAERTLIAISKDAIEFEIHISIGSPYLIPDGNWSCPIRIDGLHKNLHDIYGVDSWQSLQLALKLVRIMLAAFVEKGGRLFWERDGEEVLVDELFENRYPIGIQMNDSETDIERLHNLLDRSVRSLSDSCDIVNTFETTTDAHARAKSSAVEQLGNAIGSILYARTFLPQAPREKHEIPGEPDIGLTPEQQARVDQLSAEQIQTIDNALQANVSGQWRKMARVVASAMSDNSALVHDIPDIFYAQRLKKLVGDGQIESQGNLDYMRFSEVRLPTS